MAEQKWSDVGNSISDMVQEAIDSEDFSKLSDAIQNTVSAAISGAVTGAANGAVNGISRGMNAMGESLNQMASSMTKHQGRAPKAQNPWRGNREFERRTQDYMKAKDIPTGSLYSIGGTTRLGAYIMAGFGGLCTFGLGISVLILLVISLTTGAPMVLPIAIQAVLLAVSAGLLFKGKSALGRLTRFKNYVRMIGSRTCVTLKELASGIGKNESYVIKDVRDMLGRGMFRQGHLDEREKNLFVTDQSYEAYISDKKKAEAARAAQQVREREKQVHKPESGLSGEVKKMIQEGQGYIEKIHEANNEIQDAEVSRKLDALEITVSKIFEYVEAHPESAPETKKLMKYYLPTTIKLLDSYRKLDDHPIQGQNISESKRQIETTLDTLNQAFARLFDNLYQDTSMDIKSDISVLKTMLAQEGLTAQKM